MCPFFTLQLFRQFAGDFDILLYPVAQPPAATQVLISGVFILCIVQNLCLLVSWLRTPSLIEYARNLTKLAFNFAENSYKVREE